MVILFTRTQTGILLIPIFGGSICGANFDFEETVHYLAI